MEENSLLFTSFHYLVNNDFELLKEREVKVFFIYQNKNVIKPLRIKKNKSHPEESYYINEAKKIINRLIKNGELEEYAIKYIRKKQAKKASLISLLSLASACVIAGVSVGVYFAIQPKVQEVKVDVPEVNGLAFSNQKAYVGQDYDTNISVNKTLTDLLLPDTLKTVTSGNRTVLPTEYTYTLNDDKEKASLHIPGKYIEGDVTIDLELVSPVPLKRWYEYTDWWNYCSNGKKESEATVEDIGKDVTLTINKKEHKVRLIGVDEDSTDKEGKKKIHTTFEFANAISDELGHSLAVQWNDTDDESTANHDYLNSTLRKTLNGTGDATHILWAEREAISWSTTYKSNVLDMLISENSGLSDVLKTPYKTVMCKKASEWVPTEIKNDKLFLLSKEEIGGETDQVGAYTFYKGDEDLAQRRIKKQSDSSKIFTTYCKITYDPSSSQIYKGAVSNYAGYVGSTTGGTYFWLRSPTTGYDDFARYVSYDGNIYGTHSVYDNALAIAPAFCI